MFPSSGSESNSKTSVDAPTYFLVAEACRPQPLKVLPVLQFLAIDTHGPLVALCDAHLMAAALHILAWVLGGVHGCNNKNNGTQNSGVFQQSFKLLSSADLHCLKRSSILKKRLCTCKCNTIYKVCNEKYSGSVHK